jgi:photosystem II stability/assembly factor-like uncharacterized protein
VTVNDVVFAGTVGPQMLRLGDGPGRETVLVSLPSMDATPGREEWHRVGPALQVRSLTATADGVLLANVHVGGIVRSEDAGRTWQPTIEVDADVHEVNAHPRASEIAMAAAAVGLCMSRDGGRHWTIVDDGLHATYSRAVAFAGDDVLVSVSDGPFARQSAIYRGRVGTTRLERVRDGLPEWLEGNVDTRCLATDGNRIALADGSGSVWVTSSNGDGWSLAADGLPGVSSVVVV